MLGETEKSSDVCRTASMSEMGHEVIMFWVRVRVGFRVRLRFRVGLGLGLGLVR